MNVSSESDVTLAVVYQRKSCGDMQASPFARIDKAQERIAHNRQTRPSRRKIPPALLPDETHRAGRIRRQRTRRGIPRSGAACITAGERNAPAGYDHLSSLGNAR